MQLILISGLSGSGKSVALKSLEDMGFYCVDNLPAKLLPSLVSTLQESGEQRAAITIDVRSAGWTVSLPAAIEQLRQSGLDVRVLFLEANQASLVKRFSETRRPHPLMSGDVTLEEAIAREHELLGDLAATGHRIDTSSLSANTLRAWMKDWLSLDERHLTLYFESFGFKHGLPQDADVVFDARVLPNPFYDPALRELSGQDEPVARFLGSVPAVRDYLEDIYNFVHKWLPAFNRDNRASLTIAIGCTGGQHRSVYLVEQLALRLRNEAQVSVRHRNLWRGP